MWKGRVPEKGQKSDPFLGGGGEMLDSKWLKAGGKRGHEQVAWEGDDWTVEAALWWRLFSFFCQDAHYEEQTGEIREGVQKKVFC